MLELQVGVDDGRPESFARRLCQAVGELLAAPARLERLAAAAVEWSRRFDWDRSAEVMAEALRRAAASA